MSKILAVLGRMVVEGPYRMDPRNRQLGAWESGHNWTVRFPASLNILETELRSCMLAHVMNPVNLVESVPPNVNSTLLTNGVVPCEERLSVTVGKGIYETGDKVPIVKSTGPSLRNNMSV